MIVTFVHQPIIAISSSIIGLIIILGCLIFTRPFKKIQLNFLEIGTKMIFFVILVTFLLTELTKNHTSLEFRFKYFGNTVIALVVLLIAVNIVSIFWNVISQIKFFCEKENKDQEETGLRSSQIAPGGRSLAKGRERDQVKLTRKTW